MDRQLLLSSSPEEYMNAEQLAFFRDLLLEQKVALSVARSGVSREARGCDDATPDPLDRAAKETEKSAALLMKGRDEQSLSQINAALRRIESGEYGFCVESGAEIGIGRLLACPTAALCVEVQGANERRHKFFATAA